MALFQFIREGVNTWGGCRAGRPRRHGHNASDQIGPMPTSLWVAPATQAPSRKLQSTSAFPSALPIIDEPDLTPIINNGEPLWAIITASARSSERPL